MDSSYAAGQPPQGPQNMVETIVCGNRGSQRPTVGEGPVPVCKAQRAEAVGAQDRLDLGVFILGENKLKSNLICSY